MKRKRYIAGWVVLFTASALAQPPRKPFQSQSSRYHLLSASSGSGFTTLRSASA